MNEYQLQILSEARKEVTEIFENKVNPLFVFHNLEHTQQVINAATEIEKFYQLDDNDQFVLFISAWFHDTGFSTGRAEDHEKESVKLALDFLDHRNTDKEIMMRIALCIQATQLPQKPLGMVEKIICDADLYHLGTTRFNEMSERLKQELQTYYSRDISVEEWRCHSIEFLKSRKYLTRYCQQKLEPVKQEWIKQLQDRQGAMA